MTYQANDRPDGQYSIYFNNSGSNFQPFQAPPQQWTMSGQAVPQPQATAQPSTYYAGQGTQALMSFKSKCEGMWLGWIAFKAGQRYYDMHPDAVAAAEHGAHTLRRWWVWLFFAKVWLGSLAFLGWMLYVANHDIRGESFPTDAGTNGFTIRLAVWIVPALIALLVVWTRNIDFGLSKRSGFYWMLRPVAKVLEWFPNWALYLIVLCPLFFPFPSAA